MFSLLLTVALCGACDQAPAMTVLVTPLRVAARVIEARPARSAMGALVERKPARRALIRVADRVHERPRLRAIRRFVGRR